MVRFRTIRHRRHRARKGQVAAVATILGLLLVVTFIANFLTDVLPGQVEGAELSHVLTVENQLERFQAILVAEAHHGVAGAELSTPITLGSAAVPPFGPASSGSVSLEANPIGAQTAYSVSNVYSAPPNWGVGTSCFSGGSGHCSGNSNIDTWNVTNANGTTFTLQVTGNKNSIGYNISGNNDTVNIDWTGGDTGFIYVVVNGSYDTVNYNKGGSDTTTPTATFAFFGEHDTFSFNPSGSHSAKGGMFVNVAFIGNLNQVCPSGNDSRTDKTGTLSAGGSNLLMSVTWWNALSYFSGPTAQAYPGGGASNETIEWSNQSAPHGCAFTKAYSSHYTTSYTSGLQAQLFNRVLPPTSVAFDQGAVIEQQLGGTPIMVEPPPFTFAQSGGMPTADLTLVSFVGTAGSEVGIETADLVANVLSVRTAVLVTNTGIGSLTSLVYLNITTQYPAAWMNYFIAQANGFPPWGGVCTPITPIAAPYTCLNPPPGVPVLVTAPLYAQEVTITTVVVSLSIV